MKADFISNQLLQLSVKLGWRMTGKIVFCLAAIKKLSVHFITILEELEFQVLFKCDGSSAKGAKITPI